MRRRHFIGFVGGAAASATLGPLAARAQQQALPVIGLLHAGSREENTRRLASFLKGLADAGFVEGQNVRIEYRWASGRNADLTAMAADLPVQQASKFEFVINRKTARALGIELSPTVLATADDVID